MSQTPITIVLTGLTALALSQGVQAGEWNQHTVITFSQPFEVPGRVLPAGTYVFKLADSLASRNIVQIFNKEQNQVFGTFLAISDYRMKASDKTLIEFSERPGGGPTALKGWFYPGKTYGHEFVYPKSRAIELAKANHTPVPAVLVDRATEMAKPGAASNEAEVAALNAAPLIVEEPGGEEVAVAREFPVEFAELDGHVDVSHPELPHVLPATATSLPQLTLVGLLLAGTGITLRLIARPSRSTR